MLPGTHTEVFKKVKCYKLFQIIEGLSNLDNLLELHLENQRLQAGEKMHLEPESLNALSWLQVQIWNHIML